MTIYDSDFINTGEFIDPAAEVREGTIQVSPEAIETAEKQSQEIQEEVSKQELNFKALREEIAREKAERDAERAQHQDELQFLRHQVMRQTENSDTNRVPKSFLDTKQDDDLMTAGDYKKLMAEVEKKHQEDLEKVRLDAQEMRMKALHSDYDEVMEKYAIPLLHQDSDFARGFSIAENKAAYAYKVGKGQMLSDREINRPVDFVPEGSQLPQEPPKVSPKAERLIENSRRPGTLSNAPGGQQALSKAEYYASMSETEFQKLVAANLAEI